MSSASPFVIAADWGTSNLRLWVLSDDGQVLARKTSDKGMLSLRAEDYPNILTQLLSDMPVTDETPVLICGMAGAKTGWQDAGYQSLPARGSDLAKNIITLSPNVAGSTRAIHIISGLSQLTSDGADVMRGEETLIAGAMHLCDLHDACLCLPGTHSKWVTIKDNNVTEFTTSLTGELFALLSKHSVLAPILRHEENQTAFRMGLDASQAQPDALISQLFSPRAFALLSPNSGRDSSAYLSGLLIGAEIVANAKTVNHITLISTGALTQLYQSAFSHFGLSYDMIDAEQAAISGFCHIAQQLRDLTKGRSS